RLRMRRINVFNVFRQLEQWVFGNYRHGVGALCSSSTQTPRLVASYHNLTVRLRALYKLKWSDPELDTSAACCIVGHAVCSATTQARLPERSGRASPACLACSQSASATGGLAYRKVHVEHGAERHG